MVDWVVEPREHTTDIFLTTNIYIWFGGGQQTETIIEIHNWSKCKEQQAMVYPFPIDISIQAYTEGSRNIMGWRESVRVRGSGYLVGNSVLFICQVVATMKS